MSVPPVPRPDAPPRPRPRVRAEGRSAATDSGPRGGDRPGPGTQWIEGTPLPGAGGVGPARPEGRAASPVRPASCGGAVQDDHRRKTDEDCTIRFTRSAEPMNGRLRNGGVLSLALFALALALAGSRAAAPP